MQPIREEGHLHGPGHLIKASKGRFFVFMMRRVIFSQNLGLVLPV